MFNSIIRPIEYWNQRTWAAVGIAGVGAVTSIIGGAKAKKARKSLEGQQTPNVKQNQAIADYYKQAQLRFQASPENSQMYQLQKQNAARGLSTGISGLRDRKGLYGGISSLTQGYNNSLLKASAAAEQQKAQQFSQLGQATNMQNSDDRYRFNINQLMPYQQKRDLYMSQLSGANQLINSGITNMGNAAGLFAYSKGGGKAGGDGIGGK